MRPDEAISRVLIEHGPELSEIPNPLLLEWVVLATYLDEDGEAQLVVQPSQNQLRSHTLGLMVMAQEEM